MLFGLSEDVVNRINTVFKQYKQIDKAVIYGSRAKGNYKKGSDIDITLLGDALDYKLLMKIFDDLDELLLPYTVDLSIYDDIDNDKLKEHIDRVGKVFYEIKPRVKQDWEVKKLCEVCEIELGKTPYRGNRTFWDVGKYTKNVWLSIADLLNTDDNVVSDSKEYITDKTAKSSKIVKQGTILLSFKLTLGRLAFAGCDLFTNEAIAALNIKNKNQIDKYFLYYYLYFFDWDKAVEGDVKIKGKTLNKAKLKEIKIYFPTSLPEQQHIVMVLNRVFSAIDKAKANVEQNLKNAKELFESYLQDIFKNKSDDWNEQHIKEVCELKSGTTVESILERTYGDVIYIKIADMNLTGNEVEINTSSRFVNSREINKNQIIPESAIIFPKRGGAIATNKKRKIIKPTIIDLNTMAIIPGSKINNNFLFYWFQLINLTDISNGTSIPQINNYSFDDISIYYPKSLAEQQTIVNKLDTLSARIKQLNIIYQHKINSLEKLKKSVLQKAFNGELN